MALIPIVISPWGACGGLFNRFLYGTEALPLPNYHHHQDKPNGLKAARLAMSKTIPTKVIPTATTMWKEEADEHFYGYSYMAPDPKTWAEQQIGFTIATALSNHILSAYHQVKVTPVTECNCQEKFLDINESHVNLDLRSQPFALQACFVDADCPCHVPHRKTKNRQTKSTFSASGPSRKSSSTVATCSVVR